MLYRWLQKNYSLLPLIKTRLNSPRPTWHLTEKNILIFPRKVFMNCFLLWIYPSKQKFFLIFWCISMLLFSPIICSNYEPKQMNSTKFLQFSICIHIMSSLSSFTIWKSQKVYLKGKKHSFSFDKQNTSYYLTYTTCFSTTTTLNVVLSVLIIIFNWTNFYFSKKTERKVIRKDLSHAGMLANRVHEHTLWAPAATNTHFTPS